LHSGAFAANVPDKRSLFHPAVNPSLFESLKGRCLGVRQPRFCAALWESPMPAAGADQQEFDPAAGDPVADCCDLFAAPQSAELRQPKEFR
jgi:hypothetical protein